jgi:tetratricopeptide (TPR) repeat protein
MSNNIFLIIAAISLFIIIIIIVRKFPVLAVLNVENIPGEKEANAKKAIIKKRVDRDISKVSGVFANLWLNIKSSFLKFVNFSEKKLNKVKNNYKKKKISWSDREKLIKDLLLKAKDALAEEESEEAIEKLLEIISLEQRNLEAFFYLGKAYQQAKKWTESEQIFRHALKLAKKRKKEDIFSGDISTAEIHFSLAEMLKEVEKIEEAFDEAAEALDIEKNNPRFLDLILDLSIMRNDKKLAISYLQRLAENNPDNNKLEVWQEEIEMLKEREGE